MKTLLLLLIALSTSVTSGIPDPRCPAIKCADPCAKCFYSSADQAVDELTTGTCITQPTFFYHYFRRCPGCPRLVTCNGEIGGDGSEQQCGPTVVCPKGKQCCNASCGVCVDPGMQCTQQACTNNVRHG